MKSRIHYRSGYKYQLAKTFNIKTNVHPVKDIATTFIELDKKGNLTVKEGYAWDGVSGPVVDTDENMRASLVHDAFYQLMRQKHIARSKHKDEVDKMFRNLCKEDGVAAPIAQLYYEALRKLGNPASDPKNEKKVKQAPK